MINQKEFEQFILNLVALEFPNDKQRELYHYALFPLGKMFRAQLVANIANDLNVSSQDLQIIAAIIEIHHCYTLIHDDLPAMDNDLYRRGKKSLHHQFGEWQAILTGDGLLNLSYGLLKKLTDVPIHQILKLMNWSCGCKGIIAGQYLDLNSDHKYNKKSKTLSFSQILRIHELKTARLIQFTVIAPLLLKKYNLFELRQLLRLGQYIGVSFQILDDWQEIQSKEICNHEKNINVYYNYPQEAQKYLERAITFINDSNYQNTKNFVMKYIKKTLLDCHLEATNPLTKFV